MKCQTTGNCWEDKECSLTCSGIAQGAWRAHLSTEPQKGRRCLNTDRSSQGHQTQLTEAALHCLHPGVSHPNSSPVMGPGAKETEVALHPPGTHLPTPCCCSQRSWAQTCCYPSVGSSCCWSQAIWQNLLNPASSPWLLL